MAPRPKPGRKSDDTAPATERTEPETSKSIGTADTGSRAKAKAAHDRTEKQLPSPAVWPLNAHGQPMAQISLTASELIPTGQYANVSLGPVTITMFVDPHSDEPIEDAVKQNLANAANQIAEVVEIDILAVQRNLVLESIQSQVSANG